VPIVPALVIAHLARLCAAAGGATTAVGGTIGFRVHGALGGTWVLDLSVAGGAWSMDEAAFAQASVRVFAFARTFAAVAFDADALGALLSTGELVVQGDARKLARLSSILGGGSSPLSTRLSARPTSATL
jgi:hypothetical protein